MIAFHCDRDGCGASQPMQSASETFLTVSGGGGEISHLCSFECLTRWAATFELFTDPHDPQ